jgi:hypothetical protein
MLKGGKMQREWPYREMKGRARGQHGDVSTSIKQQLNHLHLPLVRCKHERSGEFADWSDVLDFAIGIPDTK